MTKKELIEQEQIKFANQMDPEMEQQKIVKGTDFIPRTYEESLEEGFSGFNNLKENETSLTSVAKDLMPKDFVKKYKQMKKLEAEIKAAEDVFKQSLIQMFESIPDLETNSVALDGLKFTYASAYTKTTVDSKKLKEEYPEIYAKVTKTSNVKSSIRTTIEY